MGTDGHYTCGDHTVVCKLVESLCCTPDINVLHQLYLKECKEMNVQKGSFYLRQK